MIDRAAFLLADPFHFERPERISVSGDFLDVLRRKVPSAWRLLIGGWWTHAVLQDRPMRDQGFKIHVSATNHNAREILLRVLPVLIRRQVSFKVLTGPQILSLALSKNFGRGGSGKFITVYPDNDKQFVELLESLDLETSGLKGPYILSDMRYRDSQVLYYRYGGFTGYNRMLVSGQQESCLKAPDGSLHPDVRTPYYQLPAWVEEPFSRPDNLSKLKAPLLNGRYEVIKALQFSSAGGVYLAIDRSSGDEVVLKEARPHIGLIEDSQGSEVDAWSLLEREFKTLRKLRDCNGVPRALELFEHGGHRYLVQSKVNGMPLNRFRAQDEFMLRPQDGSEHVFDYVKRFVSIMQPLLELLEEVHRSGVVICDLSPSNVLVEELDNFSYRVSLIDFEAAWLLDWGEPDLLSLRWGTVGFRKPGRHKGPVDWTSMEAHDWYSMALSAYSCLLPNNFLLELDGDKLALMLDKLTAVNDLPDEIGGFIEALMVPDLTRARDCLDQLNRDASRAAGQRLRPRDAGAGFRKACRDKALDSHQGICRYLVGAFDDTRHDRLWPSGPEVFSTNAMNLAYGASGTLAYLIDAGVDVPQAISNWWQARLHEVKDLPPGLYSGLAGIAYVAGMLGLRDEARTLMGAAGAHSLRFVNPGWVHGEAGIGHAALSLYSMTNDPIYLDIARESAGYLLGHSRRSDHGRYWPDAERSRGQPGFSEGSAGIGLFLAQFADAVDDDACLEAAAEAMSHVMDQARTSRGRLIWYTDDSESMHTPYWLAGSAGIGSALVRVFEITQDQTFLDWSIQAADGAFSRFTVSCDQFSGMSGIGELMLDCYRATDDDRFLDQACQIADSIFCYLIERDGGYAVPGLANHRLQCDFAYGAAGVGYYLSRLHALGSRRFMDVPALVSRSRSDRRVESGELATLRE
jgi:hypothetical protein